MRINDIQISANFRLYEFECKGGTNLVKVDPELVDRLQRLRTKIGRPIYITSGFRTVEHNRNVGGSPNSQHLLGKAADIQVNGLSITALLAEVRSVGFRGIGLYDSYIHVDVRQTPAFWDYRTK